MKIDWTDPSPPNIEGCRYDHVTASLPFGDFSIEWKSWKVADSYDCYFNGEHIGADYALGIAKALCLKFYTDKLDQHEPAWPCWSCNKSVTGGERYKADGDCPHCHVELDNWPPIANQTVQQLRDSDHVVIVWTPEEVGTADPDDLQSLCTERGHIYLEDFQEPKDDE